RIRRLSLSHGLLRYTIWIPFPPPAERERLFALPEAGEVVPAILASGLVSAQLQLEHGPARSGRPFFVPAVQVHAVAFRATRIEKIFGKDGAGDEAGLTVPAPERRDEADSVPPLLRILILRWPQIAAAAFGTGKSHRSHQYRAPARDVLLHEAPERFGYALAHLCLHPQRLAGDLTHGQQIARGGGNADFVRGFQIGDGHAALENPHTRNVDLIQQYFACNAWQAAVTHRRRPHVIPEHAKDIGGRALRHAPVLVQQNRFVETMPLRSFGPDEIRAPGKNLRTGEFVRGVARIRLHREPHAVAPVLRIGGQGNHVAGGAAGRISGPHPANISDHNQAQRTIRLTVGLHKAHELLFEPPRVIRHSDTE